MGIEVNPFLAFAGRAKCVSNGWTRPDFTRTIDRVLKISRLEIPSPLEGVSTFSERPKSEKWLFNRSVIRGYAALDRALTAAGTFRRPLRLALTAALMDNCNARRDGKCHRYRNDWRQRGLSSVDLRDSFAARARVVFADVCSEKFRAIGKQMVCGDSREIVRTLPRNHFDVMITSPPYLNSFDYSDVYRPELFAGGFVTSNAELRKVRLRTIRSHVQVRWPKAETLASPLILPLLSAIRERPLWDPRLPEMIQSYFADLDVVLRQTRTALRQGGQAWLVVATSAYAGIEIPVDAILGDMAMRNGWRLRSTHVLRRMRAAGQHFIRGNVKASTPPLRKSLIVLERAK